MKKLMTFAGFDAAVDERYSKKRYTYYRSFKTKNTLMVYIQVAIALAVSIRLLYIFL